MDENEMAQRMLEALERIADALEVLAHGPVAVVTDEEWQPTGHEYGDNNE